MLPFIVASSVTQAGRMNDQASAHDPWQGYLPLIQTLIGAHGCVIAGEG
jgi:urocanate hydratase